MPARIATVGTFDGLHHGHRAILNTLLKRAGHNGLTPAVITFTSHPLATIAPERAPATVMDRRDVEKALHAAGISDVIMLDFNADLVRLTAREFLRMLHQRYNVDELVMGFDNTFGSDRLKQHEDYIKAACDENIRISFVDPVLTADNLKISSSLLRHALADGNIERAHECLGHYPGFRGTVVHGKRNGHKIGFPTLNIAPVHCLPVAKGVYIATLQYGGKSYHGVLNVGNNPTFGDSNSLSYELHVPDRDLGDMYGREVSVQVIKYLRGEKKFDSIASLVSSIGENVEQMKQYFAPLSSK